MTDVQASGVRHPEKASPEGAAANTGGFNQMLWFYQFGIISAGFGKQHLMRSVWIA